jgi:hypothetical protein
VCYTTECKALAPPMRICAPWVDGCSKEWYNTPTGGKGPNLV